MKTTLLLAGLALLVGVSPAAAQASAEDEAGVRGAVEAYLRAHATGSGEPIVDVFHPVSNLYWVRGDTLNQRAGSAYIAGFRGTPAPDEAQRRRWISMVDVTGDAAIARVVLDYPTAVITDYFALLRIDGEWRIVNKIFTSQPK
ncbi:MAG TPA: nuclear transport factor 2 family protein [Longimicrobiales bacterium]|nr:nuclear transport factor 2 family protein [Longimicrobiales bacterium]